MSTRRYYNSMAALFVMVFLFIIAGVGIANAGIKDIVHDTIIYGKVHALVQQNCGGTRVDVVTESGNIQVFNEDVVSSSILRVGHPVRILFYQHTIDGLKFWKPQLDW